MYLKPALPRRLATFDENLASNELSVDLPSDDHDAGENSVAPRTAHSQPLFDTVVVVAARQWDCAVRGYSRGVQLYQGAGASLVIPQQQPTAICEKTFTRGITCSLAPPPRH